MDYGKDRQPGDDMPCPLCRKECTISDDGLSGMQKNFDMEKLLCARKRSVGEADHRDGIILCDVCSSEAASPAPAATRYCFQCQQNFCDQCSWTHAKIKATSSHVMVEINLHKQVKTDRDKITELLKKIDGVLPHFEKEKNDLLSRLADIEGVINTATDSLIAAVQRDRVKLLSEVESIKVKRVKQLETVKQEVEQRVSALESLKQYSETLLSSGTACDVTRSANSLHSRVEELVMYDVIGHVDSSRPSLNATFKSSTLHGDENRVGTISEEGLYNSVHKSHQMVCTL